MQKVKFLMLIIFVSVIGNIYGQSVLKLNKQGLKAYKEGNYTEAATLLEKAKAQSERKLKKKFSEEQEYGGTINNLGMVYLKQTKYKEAEVLLLDALGIYKKVSNGINADYVETLDNLANLYGKLSDDSREELFNLEALEKKKKLLGEKHESYGLSLNNLGVLYMKQGYSTKAEPFLVKALEITKITK